MIENIKIAIIQTDIIWENPQANRSILEEKIAQLNFPIDLIVLPEMFTTGFSMNPTKIAEQHNTHSVKWLKLIANRYQTSIMGSVAIKHNNQYFNRLYYVSSEGNIETYDKKHLFSMAGENTSYTAGNQGLIIKLKDWHIKPLICYDLRFPVFSRNTNNQYDILIYVANWPEIRKEAWITLLKARAIENISYVVGVNRVGKDGNQHQYSGNSMFINPKGEIISTYENTEYSWTEELDIEYLKKTRESFPAWKDADKFKLL